MFMLEFLSLVKEYKNCEKNTPKEKEVLTSLFKLIKQNLSEYENYKAGGENSQILKEIEIKLESLEQEQNKIEEHDDLQNEQVAVQRFYNSWLKEFKQSGNISSKNSEIILNLINTYYATNFDIITATINMNIKGDFELFKNHLKNKLRAFMSKKIEDYLESDKYKQMNFLKKIWKDKKVSKTINDLGRYNFNPKQIEEVVQ